MEQTMTWILILITVLLASSILVIIHLWLMYNTERRRNSALWQHNDQLERDMDALDNRAAQRKPVKRVA